MLTVTLVLPGCATIAVVTGLGWLLVQVTVCPVVGVSVGEQPARAGPTPREAPPPQAPRLKPWNASAYANAVARA